MHLAYADGFQGGPLQVLLLQHEGSEPVHVYVEAPGNYAKFWLGPVHFGQFSWIQAR